MQTIRYILVNDTCSANAARALRCCRMSGFKPHVIVNARELSHGELVNRLVSLRMLHPDAKILGLSEIGGECICADKTMNRLRLELSEWP